MGFFEKVASFLSATPRDMETMGIYVRCDKCGEAIGTRIHLRHDLSLLYGEGEQGVTYFVASASNPDFKEEVWVGRKIAPVVGRR